MLIDAMCDRRAVDEIFERVADKCILVRDGP